MRGLEGRKRDFALDALVDQLARVRYAVAYAVVYGQRVHFVPVCHLDRLIRSIAITIHLEFIYLPNNSIYSCNKVSDRKTFPFPFRRNPTSLISTKWLMRIDDKPSWSDLMVKSSVPSVSFSIASLSSFYPSFLTDNQIQRDCPVVSDTTVLPTPR